MHYLNELNEEQRRAVESPIDIPILVVAGAGTGKTKTLTTRIAHLVHEHRIPPSQILALTFTNKAAREMEERIAQLISLPHDSLRIGKTFHALGASLLREFHAQLGLKRHFSILDADDGKRLVREVMRELDLDTKTWEPRKMLSIISRAKNSGLKEEDFNPENNPRYRIAKLIWKRYDEKKAEQGALDFDDLLLKTRELLAEHPEIRERLQSRWPFILVDEYQDTNEVQHQILKLLLNPKEPKLFAVGDEDQNIYSWRGSHVRYILDFEKEFPEGEVIILTKNYRSKKAILDVAHTIISRNTARREKELLPQRESGEKVRFLYARDGKDEARRIAKEVKSLLESGENPEEIAVLFRANFQSRLLEEAFLMEGIPYQLVGTKFFARKEVKDLISYLRVALNPDSLADLKRIVNVPKRGLGKVSVAKIFAGRADELSGRARESYEQLRALLSRIRTYAQDHKLSETLRFIMQESGLETHLKSGSEDDQERLLNMEELVSFATKYDSSEDAIEQFFEDVALLSDQDKLGRGMQSEGKVRLMTIHAAKGLEFKHVFVVGLEQGLFPGQSDARESIHEREEERRLCYVAFTRAKDNLTLSAARARTIYGEFQLQELSEFVRDIPEELLEWEEERTVLDEGDPFLHEGETYIDDEGNERTSYLW